MRLAEGLPSAEPWAVEGHQRLEGTWSPLARQPIQLRASHQPCGDAYTQAARGAGREPCFPVEAADEARGRLQVAPHQLEGGLRPEIEPGVGSPGGDKGGPGAGVLQKWPLLRPPCLGGGGCERLSSPCGGWDLDPHSVGGHAEFPGSQAGDTSSFVTGRPRSHVHALPVLVNKSVCPDWHTSMLGPGRWTHMHTVHDLVRTHAIQHRSTCVRTRMYTHTCAHTGR